MRCRCHVLFALFVVVLLAAPCFLHAADTTVEKPTKKTDALAKRQPFSTDGNRLAYLDHINPYYPHRGFAKLTTPQWISPEERKAGVEAVIILSIDDMRDPQRYENYLRPILDRLKRVKNTSGQAPLSIFTNVINVNHPQLQTWIKEGLSFEVHTIAHPCPCLGKFDLAKAKQTYHQCVDLLNQIPNYRGPVAFRMPCCDSMNSVSPRFFAEVMTGVSKKGNYLQIDSSIFNLFTANDPDLPRELVLDNDGKERFRKYIPKGKGFVNYIEDYPYPYTIGNMIWQFPAVIPSDWEAQHLQGVNHPRTVEDLKAAIDCTVIKQGVFTFVFHPHGWIKAEQVVELIDHAEKKHGGKVKFMTFRDAAERLNQHLLNITRLRGKSGHHGVRVTDVNNDGFMDVLIGQDQTRTTRIWSPQKKTWIDAPHKLVIGMADKQWGRDQGARFASLAKGSPVTAFSLGESRHQSWSFSNQSWKRNDQLLTGLQTERGSVFAAMEGVNLGARFRDIDGDGVSELITSGVFERNEKPVHHTVFRWHNTKCTWQRAAFDLPPDVHVIQLVGREKRPEQAAFVDIDGDGDLDLIHSDPRQFAVYLFAGMNAGWSTRLIAGNHDDNDTFKLPPLIRADGTHNGFFIKGRALYWQNEDTGHLPGNVHKVTFDQLLEAGRQQQKDANKDNKQGASKYPPSPQPNPMSPQQSMKAMEIRPGFKVELVAAEPLVFDPVAFDWGPDGKLWVVEMGDYPIGVGADKEPGSRGKPGGRVVYLTDCDGDGRYDRRTVFLDGLSFPTGVMAWDKGVLVTMAPQVFYAEDTDGDGKADDRRTLFTGFGEGNEQHRVNGLRLGLDNWIHIGNGDSGGVIELLKQRQPVVLPWQKEEDSDPSRHQWQNVKANIRGKDLRVRPRDWYGSIELPGKLRIDTIQAISDKFPPWYLDATAGQTQFGRERDDWGNWFGSNNPNPGWQYIYPDHYLRRNPHFNAPPSKVMLTSDKSVYAISRVYSPSISNHNVQPGQPNPHTSANSLVVYRDDYYGRHFAPTYDTQNAFISEPVHNLIRRHVLKRDGVTYRARRAPGEEKREFLASRDIWFRPSMLRVGPDGCLWIADVYRHVIEHPKWIQDDWETALDLRAGADKGRIYRVVRVDGQPKPQAAPNLKKASRDDLVAALETANGWQRDMIHMMVLWDHRLLLDDQFREIYEAMYRAKRPTGFSIDDLSDERQKERRDQLNAAINGSSILKQLNGLALTSKRPQVRIQALCILDGLFAATPDTLAKALNDSHPAVRKHAVRLCERLIKPDNLINVRMPLYRNVIKALLSRMNDQDPAVRMQLAFTLGEWNDPRAGQTLASLVTKHGQDAHLRAAAISSMTHHQDVVLAAMFRAKGAHTKAFFNEALRPWLENVKKSPDSAQYVMERILGDGKEKFGTWQYRAMTRIAEVLGGNVPKSNDIRAAYVLLKTESLFDAADESNRLEHRIAAIEAAGYFAPRHDLQKTVLALLDNPRTPAPVQQAAVKTIIADRSLQGVLPANSVISESGVRSLFDRWPKLSPAVRQTVLGTLLTRAAGVGAVLDAVEQGTIRSTALTLSQRELILQHKSKAITNRASKLLGRPPQPQRGKVIEQYKVALTMKGNAARGRPLFQKNCAACHHLAGMGKHVGPDLRLLKNGSPAALLAAILDPNQAVESKYLNYIIETKEGDTFTGVITNESGNSLMLTGADGIARPLSRGDIVSLRSGTKSLMPEGLEEALKPQDVADVIALIRSAGPPPKVFPNNQPQTLSPDGKGVFTLPASAAEVYGPRVIFEQKYRNLGHWYHDQDQAVWSIEVPEARAFDVSLDWALGTTNQQSFRMTVGQAKLEAVVPSTGSWDVYKTKSFGRVRLPAGTHRLVFRSKGKLTGPLIDLRTITLSPAK